MMQIDENVERELVNHRTLIHPNIVKFREVRTHALISPYSEMLSVLLATLAACMAHSLFLLLSHS